MSESYPGMDRVVELSEEYLARLRRGECPTIDEYARRHPELEKPIRELFPSLRMIEELAPRAVDDVATTGPAIADPPPERIGDYHITREIGRGGMGVVYEAQQQSLRRRVALKVLPRHTVGKSTALQRFQQEAQAAARLHHTNIVPIYDVGEADGVWYYAMQLIPGSGLDQVMDQLRQLRGASTEAAGMAGGSAHTIANTILTGVTPPEFKAPATPACDSTSGVRQTESNGDCGTLPDHSDLTDSTTSRYRYFRGVARIGIQVAQALDYAHNEGIVHRDIKPSNLLLDLAANVWITDFGLAKAQGGDLTRTGDIVGTLRYMAPERFRGWSDPRSDVYGLGATLYELLVMRPAFDGSDRIELMRRVTHDLPARPRSIDPRVPRELETIVLKAIAKEPAERYASASELAEDLERYLDDKPILARPAGMMERSWRWYRRNWIVATLGSSLIALLATCCAVVFMALQYAQEQRDRAIEILRSSEATLDEIVAAAQNDHSISVEHKKRILETAIRHLAEFIRLGESDPRIRTELASVYHRVGTLKSLVGDWQGSIEPYDRQRQILQTLIASDPGNASHRTSLGGAYANLGAACQGLGDLTLAHQYYHKAIETLDAIPAAQQTVLTRAYRANVTGNMGLLLRRGGNPAAAVEKHRAEIEAREQLCREQPDNLDMRHRRARARLHLGNAALDLGHMAAAYAEFERAAKVLAKLQSLSPESTYYDAALTATRLRLAHAAQELGRLDEALEAAESAFVRPVKPGPEQAPPVALIHDRMATVCFAMGDTQRAYSHFQSAVESIGSNRPLDVAELLIHRGEAHSLRDDGLVALESFRQAAAICREWQTSGRRPSPRARHLTGSAEGGLAGVLTNRRSFDEAAPLLDRAIELHAQLVEQCPDIPAYKVALAGHYRVRALLELSTGNAAQGSSSANRSLEILERVAAQHPDVSSYAAELFTTRVVAAFIWQQLKNSDEAATLYQLGLDEWVERHGESPPGDINLAVRLGGSYCNLGLLLAAKQDHASALRCAHLAKDTLVDVQRRDDRNRAAAQYLENTEKLLDHLAGSE